MAEAVAILDGKRPAIVEYYVTPHEVRERAGLTAADLAQRLGMDLESAKKCGAIRQRMPRSRVSCPVHGSVERLLTLANCLSTTVSTTLSTIPVEAPDCHSGVGWPSVDHVAIYPHESGTAPHFLALPYKGRVGTSLMVWKVPGFRPLLAEGNEAGALVPL